MYILGALTLLQSRFASLHCFGTLLQGYFVSCPMLSALARLSGHVIGCGYVVETLSGALHIFDFVSIVLLLRVTLPQRRWRLKTWKGFFFKVIRIVVAQKGLVGVRTWRWDHGKPGMLFWDRRRHKRESYEAYARCELRATVFYEHSFHADDSSTLFS